MKPIFKTLWVIAFAVAMGYLEAAVVVYLRALYYPSGFQFPLKEMSQCIAITELFREAATLLMILSVGMLAARKGLHRFAWFLVVFSVWDITYYIFLKWILDWPASLFTTDVLFLLPGMWTGPVIAPVINSLSMIILAAVILQGSKTHSQLIRLRKLTWILLVAGSMIVVAAYMEDFASYSGGYEHLHLNSGLANQADLFQVSLHFVPRTFNWLLFATGALMHVAAIVLTFRDKINLKKGLKPVLPESES